jgi:hypothetical protein
VDRREAIKIGAAAVVALPLASQPAPPLFFTPEEFQAVDVLTEMIIPADDHSPGARAAKVAAYIDKRLAESFEPEPQQQWREGLKRFLAVPQDQWTALLTASAENEGEPKTPEELFFKELKARTAQVYYSSDIGIHKEMEYKGNTYLDDFVGYRAP